MAALRPAIFQLKVTLVDSQPPIWRRFLISSLATLEDLHQVLQLVMGWKGAHLHGFEIDHKHYGDPSPEALGDDVQNQASVTLAMLTLGVKNKFRYTYDFGDGWLHQILVEEILTSDEIEGPLPRCLEGKRACPPEDCGGIWGYEDMLSRWDDPSDPEAIELIDWIGGDFDPEAFDLAAVNQNLKPLQH